MSDVLLLTLKIVGVIVVLFVASMVVVRRVYGKADDDTDEGNAKPSEPARASLRARRDSTGLELPDGGDPRERAELLEKKFRKALSAEGGDLAPGALVKKLATTAAEAWLQVDEVRRAADIYRDARINDQALKYYVEVLGDFEEGARVASRKGDHARAAMLYTQVGDKRSACVSWLEWGRRAADPLRHEKIMRGVGDDLFAGILAKIVEMRPATPENVPLFRRIIEVIDEQASPADALTVYRRLVEAAPHAEDVRAQIARLEARLSEGLTRGSERDELDAVVLPTLDASAEEPTEDFDALPLELPRIEPRRPTKSRPIAVGERADGTGKTALAVVALEKRVARREGNAVEEQVARSRVDER